MAKRKIEAVNIFELADRLSEHNPGFSSQKKKCRQDFLEFMETNNYFGVKNSGIELFISRSDAEKICPNLELWLHSYGSGSNEKLKLLTERMTTLYPETGDLFAAFIDYSQAESGAAWKLADYLCFVLRSEIANMSGDGIDCLAADMDKELPLSSARLFSDFLLYARESGRLSNGWVYSFNSRREAEVDGAYATADFLKMSYIIFNDVAWAEKRLLEKALQSERDANLWLLSRVISFAGGAVRILSDCPCRRFPVAENIYANKSRRDALTPTAS